MALSARRAEALRVVAQDDAKALLLPMDATDPRAWGPAHAGLREAWDGVDLVVFCAADYRPLRPWELEAESVRHTIETNLNSVYYGLQATLADMLARGSASLVLVASVAGYMGLPNATVWPDQGRADQLGGAALCRTASKWAGRLPGQPRLREDPADGA
ncbi:SDR family NAD(P)-dependent oxidoreductase [Cupriavidus basilensis]